MSLVYEIEMHMLKCHVTVFLRNKYVGHKMRKCTFLIPVRIKISLFHHSKTAKILVIHTLKNGVLSILF